MFEGIRILAWDGEREIELPAEFAQPLEPWSSLHPNAVVIQHTNPEGISLCLPSLFHASRS
jgi:hypothetical protein